MAENVVRMQKPAKPERSREQVKQLQLEYMITCAQTLICAEHASRTAWEKLKLAIEEYTGKHWTQWDV